MNRITKIIKGKKGGYFVQRENSEFVYNYKKRTNDKESYFLTQEELFKELEEQWEDEYMLSISASEEILKEINKYFKKKKT